MNDAKNLIKRADKILGQYEILKNKGQEVNSSTQSVLDFVGDVKDYMCSQDESNRVEQNEHLKKMVSKTDVISVLVELSGAFYSFFHILTIRKLEQESLMSG